MQYICREYAARLGQGVDNLQVFTFLTILAMFHPVDADTHFSKITDDGWEVLLVDISL